MENNQMNQNLQEANSELSLSKNSISDLTEIRKWTLFFAILGFVGIGLMVLGGFIMGIVGSVGGLLGNREVAFLGIITVFYILLAIVYFFPVLYLLKFSTNMKLAVEKSDQNKLTAAFQFLKSHFKYVGIVTIVIFGLYILGIIIAMLVGLSSIF